jgi:putative membrane protein
VNVLHAVTDMDAMEKNGNANDHLANERTFLAWIRTSVGIMAFGFVVVKFSLFVRQVSLLLEHKTASGDYAGTDIAGVVIVAAGTLTVVLAYMRYRRSEQQLSTGAYRHSSWLLILLTAFIFLVSILLIVYLVRSL